MAFVNKFPNVLYETYVIFLSIVLILFGYPILFLILSFCWIYKQIAIKLAQKNKQIHKVLEGGNGVLAGQDPYSDPVIPLVPYYSLASKLDVPTVVKVLKEKVIEPNICPELTQRIVQKFGYHFWHSVDNFKVENHVRYLNPDFPDMPITRTEFTHLLTRKLVYLPFDSTNSPWEILVVPNMIDDRDPEVKSVFILRVNHCLMDGYSIANFLKKVSFKPWKLLGGEKLEKPKQDTPKYLEIYKFVVLLFLGPYHFLKIFVLSNDSNQFVKNSCRSDLETVLNVQCTPAISEIQLKSIKNAYGVTMSSLIITLFTQATRKCMIRAGIPLPKTIHGLLTFPLPGHQDILTNHSSSVRIPIPLNENDPRNVLQIVEREFQSLRNSVKPLIPVYAVKTVPLFPLGLRPNPKSLGIPSTFFLTNFPGPTEPSDIFGCKAVKIGLGGRLSPEIPIILGSFSLAGKFWLQVGGIICNFPEQRDADAFCESIMDTLSELEMKIK